MARVLVADNDPDALDLLLLDLRLEGHVVSGVADGTAALEACTSFAPDVVVLDHRMPPGPTGLETALVLHERAPQLPVILYSNYQDIEVVRRAREIGVTVLPKGNLRTLRTLVGRTATIKDS